MMSALRNWRRCLPALGHPASSQRLQPLAWPLAGRGPLSCAAGPDGDLACLPSRAAEFWALHGSSLCRANLARGLRVHLAGRVTPDGRIALAFLLRASTSKP